MIRVTVELLPYASEKRRQELGVINIVNDGTGDHDTGNYDVSLVTDGRLTTHARVEGFGRNRGWRALVRETLELLS